MTEAMIIRRISKIRDHIFFLFLFLLPFQTVYFLREPSIDGEKWQYGTIGLYLSSIVLAIAIVLGAISETNVFRRKSVADRLKDLWRARKSDIFLLLLVLWSGLSIVWSKDANLASFTFIKILLVADSFVMVRNMMRRGTSNRIITILFFGAALQAVIGIGQFLTQETFSSTLLGTSVHESWQAGSSVLKIGIGRFLRAYGTFPHPNVFGLFLAGSLIMAIPVIAARLTDRRLTRKRVTVMEIAAIAAIPTIVFGIGVSYSRLAWVSLLLGLIMIAVRTYKYSKAKADSSWRYPTALIVTTIVSAAIFSVIQSDTVFPRFDRGALEREGSVVDRMSTYADAAKLIKKHPLLGVGAGNYTAELIRTNPNRPIWAVQPAHDVPLLVIAELGLIGLVLSFLFAVTYLIAIFDTKNAQAYAGALFVLIPSLLLDHFLWTSNFGLLFLFVLLGISAESGSDE
jgi:O-antigen ligase